MLYYNQELTRVVRLKIKSVGYDEESQQNT